MIKQYNQHLDQDNIPYCGHMAGPMVCIVFAEITVQIIRILNLVKETEAGIILFEIISSVRNHRVAERKKM